MDTMSAWARERQERAELFSAMVQGIAREWGSDWTANTRDTDGELSEWCGTMTRASDGIVIHARRDGKVISFSPMLPRPKRGTYGASLRDVLPYEIRDQGNIKAQVSAERPVAAIARDIMRRVVEPYAALFHYVTEYQQQRQESADAKVATIARITEAFPQFKARENGSETTCMYRYGGSSSGPVGSVDVCDGGSVKLNLYSLTVEQALAVLAVLEP